MSGQTINETTVKHFLIVLLTIALVGPVLAADGTTLPEVTGPITGGQHGQPFSMPTVNLVDHGYVVEEFFLEGTASRYQLSDGAEHTPDGLWRTEREAEAVPYTTRILVVRPAESSGFNGTVVVHWQNVTAGYELGTVQDGEYLRGFAWVGVSAQKIGVDGFPGPAAAGLKQWDGQRYGSLEHPGDAYSYDIFTQAARVVGKQRAGLAVDPMAGLPVERLVAAGASQSASRLRTYINGVHPLERVFDGYIPYIDFASVVPFAADKSGQRQRKQARIRTDLGVPVFVVNSETETQAYLPARQPDSETYRFWEVAGTSHVSVVRGGSNNPEGLENPNWMSYTPVYDAAVRHMHRWLKDGKSPPKMPWIEVGTDSKIERDEVGNALGGIRLPDLVVPTAEHRGVGQRVSGGNRFAFLYGFARDFDEQELAKRYPNRQTYLERYDQALAASVDAGVLLAEDSGRLRTNAEQWAQRLPPATSP